MVKHAIVCITSDLTHDAHFVKKFEVRALNLVSKQTSKAIKTIYEWTDGCGAKYEARTGYLSIYS